MGGATLSKLGPDASAPATAGALALDKDWARQASGDATSYMIRSLEKGLVAAELASWSYEKSTVRLGPGDSAVLVATF